MVSYFLRKVRTGSGATAVQVMVKEGRRNRVVKHVGSAHDDGELAVLMARGRQELVNPDQQELDLGLNDSSERSDRAVTVAKCSVLLWQVLGDAYRELGFDALIGDEAFKQLVLARIIEPSSKLDTVRILSELGIKSAHRNTFYACLKRCVARDYRSRISSACFEHALTHGDLSLVLYDVTTLYFESEHEDEDGDSNEGLRRVGFSKERRVDPQIIVGLLVDREGFPLEIAMFEGNKAETHTIVPIIEQFRERHQIADLVIVADAGMLSRTNLLALDKAGFKFIVGSRQTKAPHDLEPVIGTKDWVFNDGELIDTITPIHANTTMKKRQQQWKEDTMTWRAIWSYSAKRATRDRKTLNHQYQRAWSIINGIKKQKKARFVTHTPKGASFDQTSFDRASKLVGLKGYVTNIPTSIMQPQEIITSYHDLWHVEQSFRMSKTDLRARPIFHHTKNAIDAHLTIVMTALAISRHLYQKTGITTKRLIRLLRPIQQQTILYAGQTITSNDPIPPTTQHILTKLGH